MYDMQVIDIAILWYIKIYVTIYIYCLTIFFVFLARIYYHVVIVLENLLLCFCLLIIFGNRMIFRIIVFIIYVIMIDSLWNSLTFILIYMMHLICLTLYLLTNMLLVCRGRWGNLYNFVHLSISILLYSLLGLLINLLISLSFYYLIYYVGYDSLRLFLFSNLILNYKYFHKYLFFLSHSMMDIVHYNC